MIHIHLLLDSLKTCLLNNIILVNGLMWLIWKIFYCRNQLGSSSSDKDDEQQVLTYLKGN